MDKRTIAHTLTNEIMNENYRGTDRIFTHESIKYCKLENKWLMTLKKLISVLSGIKK